MMKKVNILSILLFILINIMNITINRATTKDFNYTTLNSIELAQAKSNKINTVTKLDTNVEVNYSTEHPWYLCSGLISNFGNTKDGYIIKVEENGFLNISITPKIIDFDKSFYVRGEVENNEFTEIKITKQYLKHKIKIWIINPGIYHLCLFDLKGDPIYNSYIEVGKHNWRIRGIFNNHHLENLSAKLNVNVENLPTEREKEEATGWLENYKSFVYNTFEQKIEEFGKGFTLSIRRDFSDQVNWFLQSVKYYNIKDDYEINVNHTELVYKIIEKAEQYLQYCLKQLPSLNVIKTNVVNKATLDQFMIWINKYQSFCYQNFDKWVNNIKKIVGRGFATPHELKMISQHLYEYSFDHFLKKITWSPFTSINYQEFVLLDKWQANATAWIKANIPIIEDLYQKEIKNAKSKVNFHGYNLNQVLNGKQLPRTKSEIHNFADGKNFEDWLQIKVNSMYHAWQLKLSFAITITIVAIVILSCFICYRRFSTKHNPIKATIKSWKNIANVKKNNTKKRKKDN